MGDIEAVIQHSPRGKHVNRHCAHILDGELPGSECFPYKWLRCSVAQITTNPFLAGASSTLCGESSLQLPCEGTSTI